MNAFFRTRKYLPVAALVTLALAACNTGPKGVRITNNGTSATTDKTPVPITDFTAEQIRAAITGKTFQYTRNDGNGFITYNADGTFSFQDDANSVSSAIHDTFFALRPIESLQSQRQYQA